MDENMAAPTSRWLLRRIGQKGHRFYYTGAGDKIFKTNEPTDIKVDETLAKNPFFDKYAAKINKLQQENPQKLANGLEEVASRKKPGRISDAVTAAGRAASEAAPQAKAQTWAQYMQRRKKSLDSVMKTELLGDKSADQIRSIWGEYFTGKTAVMAAVLTSDCYDELRGRSDQHATFVLPLPRDDGYEFIVCQFAANEAHFASLINFQTHGENAPECLTLVFYDELQKDKHIVLVKGDFDKDVLSAQEARCLLDQVMLYYVRPSESKLRLLQRFTCQPDQFRHEDLITELENIQL